jgi:hypothetical protein
MATRSRAHHLKAFTMNRSGTSFQVVDGGREALEREYMWAIVFDHPNKHNLARRLEPSANDVLCVVRPADDETEAPPPSGQPDA